MESEGTRDPAHMSNRGFALAAGHGPFFYGNLPFRLAVILGGAKSAPNAKARQQLDARAPTRTSPEEASNQFFGCTNVRTLFGFSTMIVLI